MWNIKFPEEEKVQKLSDVDMKLLKYIEEKKSKKNTSNDNKKQSDINNKWAWKKKGPKLDKPWTKKFNKEAYNCYKWHKAWIIHGPNTTSGPNTCKLRLVEEAATNSSHQKSNQGNSITREEGQVHATQALMSNLDYSL